MIISKNGAAPFATAKSNRELMLQRTTGPRASGLKKRRLKMNVMSTSNWMDKVGMTVINAILLAGLPLAVVAIFTQAF